MISVRLFLPALVAVLAVPLFSAEPRIQVRRLTHNQYNNTVRDLLGDHSRPADQFPPEDFVNGFKNQASAQDVPPLLAQVYANAAERMARTAFLGGRDDHKLVPCQPASATDERCAGQFISQFGRLAFRRPLSPAEQQRYAAVLIAEARRRNDFFKGAQTAVQAFLQSPKFLFRIEQGGPHRRYDVASRLSYFLWETMPDADLMDAAARGELDTGEGVERMVRRMVDDPRARAALDEFVAQWLRFDLILNSVKDRRLFPQFNEELAVAMAEETRRTVSDVVWGDRNFLEIFTARYGFLNADLAALYKLPPPAQEFAKTAYPESSGRAGILSQAMFLALTSKPGETSPTIRGYFVRDHFLCQQVPDPPPGTNSNLPPLSADRPLNARQRLSEHVANPVCAGCHRMMDPIGFGLEGYDAIGRARQRETLTFFPTRESRMQKEVAVELELDTSGLLADMPGSGFSGPAQLGRILAESPRCQECVVKQLFRYAQGRKESDGDKEFLQGAFDRFRVSGFRFKELMIWVARNLADTAARD